MFKLIFIYFRFVWIQSLIFFVWISSSFDEAFLRLFVFSSTITFCILVQYNTSFIIAICAVPIKGERWTNERNEQMKKMNRLKIEIRGNWINEMTEKNTKNNNSRDDVICRIMWFSFWFFFKFFYFNHHLLFIWNHISINVNWFIRSWHFNASIACRIIIIKTTFYQTSISENWSVYDQFIDKIEFRIYSFMTRIKHTIRKKRNKNKKYKFRKTTKTTTTTTTTDEEEKKMTNVKYTKQSKNVNW